MRTSHPLLAIATVASTATTASALDFHGYIRDTLAVNGAGGGQVCFQLPGSEFKARLGNECDHYWGLSFVRVPGTTRINAKLVETARGDTTDINLLAARPPPEALAELDRRVLALGASCAWCVLAGSVPAGVPPSVYAGMVARLRERGCAAAVDTSGAPLADAIGAAPDLVKPNRAELGQLVGASLPPLAELARAACDLRRRGPRYVVVSLGAEGALLTSDEGAWVARPPHVSVATTVGAGDALVAGLVATLLEGGTLADAARRATAFAPAKVSRVGPRLWPPDAVRALEGRIDVRELRED